MNRIIAIETAVKDTVHELGRPTITDEESETYVAIMLEKLWDAGIVLEYSSRLIIARAAMLALAVLTGFGLASLGSA